MIRRGLTACALLVGLGAGCNTAVGNYFANRARDFGECFRAEIRFGPGLGAAVRGGGLLDAGLLMSGGLHGVGWTYGDGRVFSVFIENSRLPSDMVVPGASVRDDLSFGEGLRREAPQPQRLSTYSYGVPSAIWTYAYDPEKPRWIWDPDVDVAYRVHAFDVEVIAHAGIAGVAVGFSLGQFVDFLLGWFGLDIAGDDSEWKPPK